MGMKITNMTEVVLALQLVDKNVNEEVRKVLHKGAADIRDTAIAYAPIDEGNLEKAIHLEKPRGNQYSLKIVISVSGIVGGRDVEEYAAIVHEYTWDKRGPLTRAKSSRAGPRYLSRAMDFHGKKLQADLVKAVNHGIAKGIRTSGVNRKRRSKR